jgi:hypothetical protein
VLTDTHPVFKERTIKDLETFIPILTAIIKVPLTVLFNKINHAKYCMFTPQ